MFHTRAIVLSTRLYREYDELISLFTERFGKQIVRARGTRKATSKLAATLHGSSVVECGFVEGKHYPILTSADYFSAGNVSPNFYGRYFLYAFLVLCDDILYEGDKDEKLWTHIYGVVDTVLTSSKKSREEWLVAYDTWLQDLSEALGVLVNSHMQNKVADAGLEGRASIKKVFWEAYAKNPYPLEPFIFHNTHHI